MENLDIDISLAQLKKKFKLDTEKKRVEFAEMFIKVLNSELLSDSLYQIQIYRHPTEEELENIQKQHALDKQNSDIPF